MNESIKIALKIIWLIVIGYWVISSFNTRKTKKKTNGFKNFIYYWLPLLVAVFLLGPGEWFGHTWLRENFVEHTNTVGITGLVFCIAGAVICCWARYTLGKNWALSVQEKSNHELITNGLYKIIRHPIYTGLIILFVGNAVIVGDYRAILSVLIVVISFVFKLKKEEKLMKGLFGEQYQKYKQKTNALIPYLY
jgi:protein-S-isoprenylcysteine O-methyltransferase Ste14